MPFTQKILLHLPALPLGVILVSLSVALSILGLWIVWRFVPRPLLKAHHELCSPIFGAVALAYTVLLAFVVVIAWQNFDKAHFHVQTEANALMDLHRSAVGFEASFRDQLRSTLEDYAQTVVHEEWPALARGEESAQGRALLRQVWDLYGNYEPKSEKERLFFAESLRKLIDLRENRRLRIVDSRSEIPPILWFVLVAGAVITVGFTFFLGSDKFIVHAVMASALAAFIALILLTVISLEFPFTGDVRIGSSAFQEEINF
jgi:ABC-type multidrug transport system fused ATPase/permease subunit